MPEPTGADAGTLVRDLARPLVERPPVTPTPVGGLRRRNRRRRQRNVAAAGALTALLALAVLIVTAPFGSDRSIRTTTVPTTAPLPASTQPTGLMHLWSPADGYAINGIGLSVTDDAGAHWRNIAPPDTYDPVGHMTAIDVLDSRHLWTSWALNSHPVTNYRTTDGGRTWVTDAVCDGTLCPYFDSISFADARHGWAVSGGTSAVLRESTDGGAHWSIVGPAPFDGQIEFVDAEHGWARAGPYGFSTGAPSTPVGTLFRTADAGRTWTPVEPLPVRKGRNSSVSYTLPRFFGTDAVTAAWVESRTGTTVELLTSHDAGSHWVAHRVLSGPNATRYVANPPFSAATARDAVLYLGPDLRVTHDGGAHWRTIRPKPTWNRIDALEFATPEHGWAIVIARDPACRSTQRDACNLPVLVSTDDGGRTWSVLSPQ